MSSPISTVLVCDDERAVVEVTAEMLRSLGLQVTTAGSAREAIDILEKLRFDLVMLDFNMPELNGAEALSGMRKLHPELKVVIMSGQMVEDVVDIFEGQVLHGFLMKPFCTSQLKGLVEQL